VAAVDALQEMVALAGDVRGVAVEDRLVASADLPVVVRDDQLRGEAQNFDRRVALRVADSKPALDVARGDAADVETDVVARKCSGRDL
jgi:hypothetical protein